MIITDAVNSLYATYSKYGVTKEFLQEIITSGLKSGFSVRAAYNGIRMCLGKETNEREYFTLDEVQELTGETHEELIARAEQMRNDLRVADEDSDDYIKEIPPANHKIVYFPTGLTS